MACYLLEQEIQSAYLLSSKNMITSNYFILRSKGQFEIVPEDDVIWIYQEDHKTNGKSTFSNLVIVDKSGKSHSMYFDSDKEAESKFYKIKELFHWFIYGFSSKLHNEIMGNLPLVAKEVENKRSSMSAEA